VLLLPTYLYWLRSVIKPLIADLSPGFLNLAALFDSGQGYVEIISLRQDMNLEADFEGNFPVVLRPSWDAYFLGVCYAIAERGDCTRAKVGAVIVDKHHRIMATGYNGAPPGEPGCLEGACPRGQHYAVQGEIAFSRTFCACGNVWPCIKSAKPGSGSYDDCISVHAEANAIIYAGRDKCLGSTLYVTYSPCINCMKLVKAAGLARVLIP